MELITTSVTKRTKWKNGKKLAKKIYVARCIFLDDDGKQRERTREARTEAEAKDFQREFQTQFKRSGGREIEAAKMTFNDLANHYEKHFAKAAEYVGDKKIAGVRSLATAKHYVKTLREHFGNRKLKGITYGHLSAFRALRLKTPTVHGKQRSIAAVNRELAYLRRILNIAQSEGWILKNPFNNGSPLINIADEPQRQRVLSLAEEKRLLKAAEQSENEFLKAIIVCLIDTGFRKGELLKLVWADVDFDNETLFVKAFNSKTAKPKTVPMTARLRAELVKVLSVRLFVESGLYYCVDDNGALTLNHLAPDILQQKPLIDDKLVFGIKSNFNRSFATSLKRAGIAERDGEKIVAHSLRHTTGTRLNGQGLSQASIARALGHSQTSTTYRYINADADHSQTVKQALESYHLPADGAIDAAQESDTVN